MWELELRNAGKSSFYSWQRGTLEECLSEMFSLKEGGRIELDAMRLTWQRDELEPELPELAPGEVQHQHVWHEDFGQMAFTCVYSQDCPARITWEERYRAGVGATAQVLNTLWAAKLAGQL